MFSKACEYGIRAMVYIVSQSMDGHRIKVIDLANDIDMPEAFTGKVLSTLTQRGLVQSLKGPYGGFFIDQDTAKRIHVSDIVRAIDGDGIFEGCALGLRECDHHNPCPMHAQFVHIRNQLKDTLDKCSLYDLAERLRAGETVLFR